MEETVEMIVNDAIERVKEFGYDDQNWILNEVASRLLNVAGECLKKEYLGDE